MRNIRRWLPGLLLVLPSLILVGIFVYGLIFATIHTSMTDQHRQVGDFQFVGLQNYRDLFGDEDFRYSLRNLLLYTLTFLVGTLSIGFMWAWILEHRLPGEGFFRAVYLFPMAVSFVASGVASAHDFWADAECGRCRTCGRRQFGRLGCDGGIGYYSVCSRF